MPVAVRERLVTSDAQSLYARFGFTPLAYPERHMEMVRPSIYQEQDVSGVLS